jgi:hypothetical protein
MAGKTRRQSNEGVDAVTARVTALEAGPTITAITATGAGSYSVPAGTKWLRIRACAAGGSGGGGGTAGGAGTAGGSTSITGSALLLSLAGGGAGAGGVSGGATGPDGGIATVSSPAIQVQIILMVSISS